MLEALEFWTKQVFFRKKKKTTTKTHTSHLELFQNLDFFLFFSFRTLQFWAQIMLFLLNETCIFNLFQRETKDPREIVINYPGNRHLLIGSGASSIRKTGFSWDICVGPAWTGPVCPVWVMKWSENPKNWHSDQAGALMQLHQRSLNSLPSAGIFFSCCPSFGFFLHQNQGKFLKN